MRVGLLGYGKMGKALEQIALAKRFEITHVIKSPDQLEGLKENPPDVAIEFTQPKSAFQNIRFCIENAIPVISGTTGWLNHYKELATLCIQKDGTLLHSSNFSIGVNLFFELNEWLVERIARLNFNCKIEEVHHTEKIDSPSGTAIKLAEGIIDKNSEIASWTNKESTDHTKLGIISKRIPNVPGTHTVSYSSNLESINIQHVAHERNVFAEGAVMIAEWIKDKKGIFTMSDFINEKVNSE